MRRKKSKEEIEEERDWNLLRDESLRRWLENETPEEAKLWDEFARKQLTPKSRKTKKGNN